MNDEPALVVDEEKIKKCAHGGIPLTITSYTLPHEVEVYITQVLALFLKHADCEEFKDYIEYCVLELAVNAKKANTKRVYFFEKKLDINNPEEYKKGILFFKPETMQNIDHYLAIQRERGCYIKVIFLNKKESVIIEVRNNFVISGSERARIYDKLVKARQYDNLADAFSQVLDDSEGAGLGLVVLVLMLKKMGLDESCFKMCVTETETVARITIPFDHKKISNINELTNAIVENVKELPQFPENIIRLQKLVNNPRSEMIDIAKTVAVDPSMTADIIKLVNSPLYMPPKKVESIISAVKTIGIKGIKNLLYSYGTQKVLGQETEEKMMLWRHCYKTAFYAYNIVRNFSKDRSILDDSYICAMLHDMGKIIFSKSAPQLAVKIQGFCTEKNIPQVTFEDVTAGMNHAEIGARVAEKWNFPAGLVAAIRYHHDPLAAPKEFRSLVDAVYLANMLCQIEQGNAVYEQLEPATLQSFKFEGLKHLETIAVRLFQGFEKNPNDKPK
ncbi:MAG: HDOD domain-containing protein [Spirochaetaceae bacterium]|jgi:putative nucleotidyltransferase with HDIG domain|nr:HDOD domain-containing protein [Spirochaetaceae bacterium]